MADNLTSDISKKILDHLHGVATLTITTPLKLALLSTIPDDSSAGTEITGGSYARQTVTLGAADLTTGTATTTADVTFAGMPDCEVAGFAIYDSAGTPKRIWQGPAAALRTLTAGDTYTVLAGELTVALS